MPEQSDAHLELTQWIIPILKRNGISDLTIGLDANSLAQYHVYQESFEDYAQFSTKGKTSTLRLYVPDAPLGVQRQIEKTLNTDQYFLMGKMKAKISSPAPGTEVEYLSF